MYNDSLPISNRNRNYQRNKQHASLGANQFRKAHVAYLKQKQKMIKNNP
jgi:hypothetical protein